MSTLDEVLNEINKAKNIVILTHENPDGDAIGSSLALYKQLKIMNKDVELILPKYSRNFESLPGIKEASLEKGTRQQYDLAISLDSATIKLLSDWADYFDEAKERVVIDHHSTNTMFGDLNYVEISSPACAQTLYEIFKYYNWDVNAEIGTCLMTGIITDTGGFQYSGISSETFKIASELIKKGVNISKIYKQMLETRSRASFELKRIALNRMEFLEDGKIAFTYITKRDEKKTKAEFGDYEGIVNEGKNIEGVEVSVFLHELDDGFKASLRSNNYVNVSDVCLMFGGGGHVRAAGATMHGTPKKIRDKIIAEVKRQLK